MFAPLVVIKNFLHHAAQLGTIYLYDHISALMLCLHFMHNCL